MTLARLLLNVSATVAASRRTGVQRVVLALAKTLPTLAPTDLVVWDAHSSTLRYADRHDFDALFGARDWPEGLRLRQDAHRVGTPFTDCLEAPDRTWLLDADLAYHAPGGVEGLARRTTQLKFAGVRTAFIAHDLIPIYHPDYMADRAAHQAYVAELVRANLLLAISAHTAQAFAAHWQALALMATPEIRTCLLPDGGFGPALDSLAKPEGEAPHLVMLGSVEPRKRQLEVLEAFAAARRRSPALANARLTVIGALHPAVAKRFLRLIATTPGVAFLDHAPDAVRDATLRTASATVFASEEEGFGLPIAESLAHGLPCLCANFGAMAEVAANGGCLTLDVRDKAALEAGLISLCEDKSLMQQLKDEITARQFRTWADYAKDVVLALSAQAGPDRAGQRDRELAYRKMRGRNAAFVRLRLVLISFNTCDATLETVLAIKRRILPLSPQLDLVIIERGSTDDSLMALAALRHPRLCLVVTPADLGEAAALQDAARLDGADYIQVIRPGQALDEGRIRTALNALAQHPCAWCEGGKGDSGPSSLADLIWRHDLFATALDIAISGDDAQDLAMLGRQVALILENVRSLDTWGLSRRNATGAAA